MNKKHAAMPCIIWVIICLIISGLAGWASATHVNTWYITLHKPWFQPPAWVFGPTWTLLYIMIGIAGGLLWHNRQSQPTAMKVYILQLALNFAWSFIFFVGQSIGWALVDIVVLWLAIGWTVVASFHSSKAAAWLLIPYWLWVTFATLLNASLWFLNH
ncbi:MAG: tryptophan-rich sensory protein [Coxiellaceae bacterium]|nr:tryptophan-rich sensory protein [Coxiellaceae bacterium]